MHSVRRIILNLALALCAVVPVRAAIVVTTLEEPIVMFSDLNSILYLIDVNENAVTDFTFGADVGFNGLRTERGNRIVIRRDPHPNLGGPVAPLGADFLIGPGLSEPPLEWMSSNPVAGYVEPDEIAFSTLVICVSTGCGSAWPQGDATRAFIGFEFEIDESWHFGYFDISLSGSSTGAALYGWAYNSIPDEPIRAGEVPEPVTVALFSGLGALIFAGIARRRIRGGD